MLPLLDTLAGVCQLLDPAQTQEYFTGLPGLLAAPDRRALYAQLAPLLAKRTFLEMAAALDGLVCGEALHYWQQNQAVLDEVFATGGLELFVYETIPFAKPDLLTNLGDIQGIGEGLRHLLERSHRLAPLEWAESELWLFASLLHAQEPFGGSPTSYLGLGRLGDWLHRLDLPLPVIASCNEETLLAALRLKPLAETRELFAYLWLSDPTGGQLFIVRHKESLVSYLKQQTDTPTLLEDGLDLVAEYLLEFGQGGQGNELSVGRLEVLATFLPGYAHYRSKAIIFPIRPTHLYTVALMNAEKRMTVDTLLLPRAARINRLWADTILHLYRAKSLFEWQQSLLTVRQTALELTKQLVRFLEIRLEQQSSREEASIAIIVTQSELLETQRQQRPKLPVDREETSSYSAVERIVEDWLGSLRNFVGQFGGLVAPRNGNSRNLATYHLTEVVQKLPAAQAAHRAISARHTYFDLTVLEQAEAKWYARLLDSTRFYVHWQEKQGGARLYGVGERIRHWVDAERQAHLTALYAVLRSCEQMLPVRFYLPTRLKEEGILKTAVIGIEGLDFQDEQLFSALLLLLTDLSDTNADYFLLLPVRHQRASNGLRCTKEFLGWLKALANGEEAAQPADWQLPLPVAPTVDDLRTLEGVEAEVVTEPEENGRVLNILQALWKLLAYRQRLVAAPTSARAWLPQVETATRTLVDRELRWLQPILSEKKLRQLAMCSAQCFAGEAEVNEDYLVEMLEQAVKI